MDQIKVRTSAATKARSASSVNRARLQRSTTLNRKFVKKPVMNGAREQSATVVKKQVSVANVTPVKKSANTAQISASAARESRLVAGQKTQKRLLITKKKTVKIQPSASSSQQVSKKCVQPSKMQKEQPVSEEQIQQRLASRTSSNAISSRMLAAMKPVVEPKQVIKKAKEEPIAPARDTAVARAAKARIAATRKSRQQEAGQQLSAQELKERAIQKAMRSVATMNSDENNDAMRAGFWKKKRATTIVAMAVVAFGLLGYLVSVNLPDISVRVAAMHSGIEKAYPSYVPSSYRLDGLVKEDNGRITMAFRNDDGQSFTLMEEKSSWDSSAVLTNYVIKNWGASYTIARGRGLTIYISGSNAAWVNGGVFYTIIDDTGSLSSSDLHDIAISL